MSVCIMTDLQREVKIKIYLEKCSILTEHGDEEDARYIFKYVVKLIESRSAEKIRNMELERNLL